MFGILLYIRWQITKSYEGGHAEDSYIDTNAAQKANRVSSLELQVPTSVRFM